MYKFKFADIGEGLHEGTVGEVYVKVGDVVAEGDSLFSVETDKVTSDIPSPVDGKILEIKIKVGETIHVGDDIFHLETDSASSEAETPKEEQEEAASVVGSIEVSNNLFSFDKFKQGSSVKSEDVQSSNSSNTPTTENHVPYKGEEGKKYTGKVDKEFDVIVVGSGPGGYLIAEEVAKSGKSTLIVEKEFWGGVCLNVGCIPTKTLIKSIEVYQYASKLKEYGIKGNIHDLVPDWVAMQKRKQEVVDKLTGGIHALLKGNKAMTILGHAKFVGAHTIEVEGKFYKGKKVVIATGSTANRLPLPGFEEGYKAGKVITSKEGINLKKLPKSLAIIGGGVIGVEFAQVFAANGVKVTILQNLDKILHILDKDVIKEITKELKNANIDIITNTNIKKYENGTIYYEVDGKEQTIKTELVMQSVGRKPQIEGLKEVGLKIGERNNLQVDYKNRTNVEGVYGIGDVVGQAMLAHVAYKHAIIVSRHINNKPTSQINAKTIPACIYTHPEVASVGLTEEEAKSANLDYIIVKGSMMTIGKALADGDVRGFIKLIIDKEYGEIIGAHLVGKHSTDMITEITMAIDSEATIYDVANTIHPHPTVSEIIWEAARKAVAQLEK